MRRLQRRPAAEGHGTTSLRDAIVAIGDYAVGHRADRQNELRLAATIQLTPRVHRIRMLGTAALDLAWVADGRLDASITLDNNPWDTLAGVLLAREAGARVVDADGSPHDLHSGHHRRPGPSDQPDHPAHPGRRILRSSSPSRSEYAAAADLLGHPARWPNLEPRLVAGSARLSGTAG
jgi:hypothetical protein